MLQYTVVNCITEIINEYATNFVVIVTHKLMRLKFLSEICHGL